MINEDQQRDAMYKGWAAQKTFLTPIKTTFDDNVLLSVNYNGIFYEQRFYYKDVFGLADPTSIAFSRLQSELNRIDRNIELNWPPKDENIRKP